MQFGHFARLPIRRIGCSFSLLILFSFTLSAQPKNKVVLFNGEQKTAELEAYRIGDNYYVDLNEVAAALKLRTFNSPEKHKTVLFSGDHEVKIAANSPFFVLDKSEVIQFPVSSLLILGKIFVPAAYLESFFTNYLDWNVGLKAQGAVQYDVVGNASKYNVRGITAMKKANGILIRIKTRKKFGKSQYESWINKGWLYLTLSGGTIDLNTIKTDLNLIKKEIPLFSDILAYQHKNSVQLSFKLKGEIKAKQVLADHASSDLILSLTTDEELEQLLIDREKWKINKIVLDAGHGGKDPGAIGYAGSREKDATLGIVLELGKLIESKLKIPVVYTRKKDKFLDLWERTQMANKKDGKLFVSVHCNSNNNKNAHGFETYFLAPSRDKEALDVAKKENAVIKLEETSNKYIDFTDEKAILANMMQSVFVKDSEQLAFAVQKGIKNQVDMKSRGVKQAPFYVLMGASMPCILVETAFISNPQEEKFLKSKKGRKGLAEGILKGIESFIKEYEKQNFGP